MSILSLSKEQCKITYAEEKNIIVIYKATRRIRIFITGRFSIRCMGSPFSFSGVQVFKSRTFSKWSETLFTESGSENTDIGNTVGFLRKKEIRLKFPKCYQREKLTSFSPVVTVIVLAALSTGTSTG